MSNRIGDPFHGEINSSDASGGVTVTLYKAGSTTAYALGAKEFISVTDVLFASAAGGLFTLTFGTAGAGLYIAAGTLPVTSTYLHHFETPRTGPEGTVPKLVSPAGVVNLVITGFITER